jgi:1-acyl-sn-glycerol-3-phosphate acyltransferase/nucleoside-diphosphate-sugar epimerase
MSATGAVIAGKIGPLARAAAQALERRGCAVTIVESRSAQRASAGLRAERLLYFPFPPGRQRSCLRHVRRCLSSWRSWLEWAGETGVRRVVMRSHAVAYGTSMKNPGLLDEGRVSLLDKASVEQRWLAAEDALLNPSPLGRRPFTAASIRLTSVLDPHEGDLIAAMLGSRLCWPLAGYNPQIQLLSLADAAECLACAVMSDATGVFNGAPEGTVPVRAALKAAAPLRLPINGVLQKPVRTLLWKANLARFPGETMDCIKYNWTVSGERARGSLGFSAARTSPQALREYLKAAAKGKPERIKDQYDEFGLDPEYLARRRWWFRFLCRYYWRAEAEGLEHIPAREPALLVANHRGFMPFDGVVHRNLILEATGRHIRILVIPSLFKFPFLSDFLIRQGGVVASQVNTQKLFSRRELVGVFPEGINGAFRMYRGAYRLGDMGRNAFAKMAIESRVPIIPCATIGHVEIFPILAKVRSSLVVRHLGWPFLPITPTFPLLPVPLPTKWHIRYLPPVPVAGLSPEDAADPKVVRALAAEVADIMQRNIDDMLRRRKHIFFGNIFERPAPGRPA